jgi:hypothetical protein
MGHSSGSESASSTISKDDGKKLFKHGNQQNLEIWPWVRRIDERDAAGPHRRREYRAVVNLTKVEGKGSKQGQRKKILRYYI